MKLTSTSIVLLSLLTSTSSLKILIGNDDSWGTANIKALYQAFKGSGNHQVLLSAPAMQQSGTNGKMRDPEKLKTDGEFGLTKKGDPAEGSEKDDDHYWYVNSTPASSIKYGLEVLSPKYFGSQPDLVLTGVNQGSNVGLAYLVSGTYGAARYSLSQGIPSIAISSANSSVRPFSDLGSKTSDDQARIYADQVYQLVDQLDKNRGSDKDLILPKGVGLNVNFPSAFTRDCKREGNKWVLTRLLGNIDRDPDTCLCSQTHAKGCKLPLERNVIDSNSNSGKGYGCTNSISVFEPTTWSPDASAENQGKVAKALEGFLSCL